MGAILGHLAWPGFDAVYPNLVASILWATPAFVVHHWLIRRRHLRALDEHTAQLRGLIVTLTTAVQHHHDTTAVQHAKVTEHLRRLTPPPVPPAADTTGGPAVDPPRRARRKVL